MDTIIVSNKVVKIYLDEEFVEKSIGDKAIKVITELLELYPNIIIKEFGEVDCYNNYSKGDSYNKRYNTGGAFNPGYKRILFVKESTHYMPLEAVILHEFAHAIDYFLIKDKLISSLSIINEMFYEYSKSNESKFVTEISSYALNNEQEFFAEWFASFYSKKENNLEKYNRPIIECLNNIQDKLLTQEQKDYIETTNRFKKIETVKKKIWETNKRKSYITSREELDLIFDEIEKYEIEISNIIKDIMSEK